MARTLAVAVLAGLTLFISAGPAAAHNVLIGSDPADGATAAAAPSRATLQFNLPVRAGFNTLVVVGPDGLAYQDGGTQVDGSTISVGLRALGPAGRYEVRYRIVSDDGHPVKGVVAFTLSAPGGGTGIPLSPQATPSGPTPPGADPTGAAPTGDSGGAAPLWPWIVAAALLVAAGIITVLRMGR